MCGFVLLMDDPSSTIVGFFCTFFFCQNAPFQISIASKSKRRRTCGVREFSATVEQTSAFYCLFWNDAVLWGEGKWNNQNLRVDCGEIREGWGHWGVKIRKRTPLIHSSSFPKKRKRKEGWERRRKKGAASNQEVTEAHKRLALYSLFPPVSIHPLGPKQIFSTSPI